MVMNDAKVGKEWFMGSKFPTPISLQGFNGCVELCLNGLFKL